MVRYDSYSGRFPAFRQATGKRLEAALVVGDDVGGAQAPGHRQLVGELVVAPDRLAVRRLAHDRGGHARLGYEVADAALSPIRVTGSQTLFAECFLVAWLIATACDFAGADQTRVDGVAEFRDDSALNSRSRSAPTWASLALACAIKSVSRVTSILGLRHEYV